MLLVFTLIKNEETAMKKHVLFPLIYLFILALITSCGGGGGGGGAVSFQDNPGLHNGGGAGGWGNGNQTGGGFGGSEIQNSNLLISQMAALEGITKIEIHLTINGVEQEVIVADATTTTDVLPEISVGDIVSGYAEIYLADRPMRTAQLDETEITLSNTLKFKVPYYYTAYALDGSTELVSDTLYYARDGIDLSAYTTGSIVGWECNGIIHSGGYVTGVRGDIDLFAKENSGSITIPDVSLSVSGSPSGSTLVSGVYQLTNMTGDFKVKASPQSGTFPSGVKYVWSITMSSGGSIPAFETSTDEITLTLNSADVKDLLRLDEIRVSKNSSNASRINVSCTVKHDSLPSSEWKDATPPLQIKIWKAPIGTKPAPDTVGDIVFKDGSACASGSSLSADQQNAAIAVCFDAANKLGVAKDESTVTIWAPGGTYGYNHKFSTSVSSGSGNWGVIQSEDPSGAVNAATNYPAFNYCNNYNAAGVSGWYLPAIDELSTLSNSSTLPTVNAALSQISGSTVTGYYWSSSQYPNTDSDAWAVWSDWPNQASFTKDDIINNYKVRPIKKFD